MNDFGLWNVFSFGPGGWGPAMATATLMTLAVAVTGFLRGWCHRCLRCVGQVSRKPIRAGGGWLHDGPAGTVKLSDKNAPILVRG
jgi:hypothetical protein